MQDCFLGGDERIRFYTMGYNIRTCPRIIFLSYCWLVIENATEADAELAYECQAGFTAFNPSRHEVIRTVKHSLIPSELKWRPSTNLVYSICKLSIFIPSLLYLQSTLPWKSF